jgi:hypothetical protein
LTTLIIKILNEKCHAPKGKQNFSCCYTKLKFVNLFVYKAAKSHNK